MVGYLVGKFQWEELGKVRIRGWHPGEDTVGGRSSEEWEWWMYGLWDPRILKA